MIVNIAIRRQVSQLQYFTDGNIPDAFASLPASWSPSRSIEFQKYWDALLADTATRRKVRWLPGEGRSSRSAASRSSTSTTNGSRAS
jgi:hypothetical protein